jgi:hypothetical protein
MGDGANGEVIVAESEVEGTIAIFSSAKASDQAKSVSIASISD